MGKYAAAGELVQPLVKEVVPWFAKQILGSKGVKKASTEVLDIMATTAKNDQKILTKLIEDTPNPVERQTLRDGIGMAYNNMASKDPAVSEYAFEEMDGFFKLAGIEKRNGQFRKFLNKSMNKTGAPPRAGNLEISSPPLTTKEIKQTSQAYDELGTSVPRGDEPGDISNVTPLGTERTPGSKSSSTHHIYGASDSAAGLKVHPQGEEVRKYAVANYGVEAGDTIGNYIKMYDTFTMGTRRSKEAQILEMYPNLPDYAEDTIKDALGGSEFSKAPNLTPQELLERSEWQKWKKEAGSDDIIKEPKYGTKEGPFPTIRLVNKDGSKTLLKFDTLKEYKKKWDVIGKHYGVPMSASEINKIKLDPNLDFYSPDHMYLHDMLKQGPALKEYKAKIEDGRWAKMNVPDAAELWARVEKEARTMAINMANYRYQLIAAHYKKFKGGEFKNLPIDKQKEYIKQNLNDLVSLGGVMKTKSSLLPDVETLLINPKENPDIDLGTLKELFFSKEYGKEIL